MTRSETTLAIRKVLVALDASRQSRLALDAAARLAQWHQAELQGLYVEDIDLVRLATLPVGQEIGQASPLPLKLDSRRLARRFSGGAAEAERWLAETAGRRNVRWTFRVERGEVTSVIAQAAGGADVVALGRAGTGTSGPGRLGSTARAIATGQTQSVILIQAPLPAGETVVALFDGSEACARSVRTSALLCERLDARLVILVPISDPTESPQRSQLMEEGRRPCENGRRSSRGQVGRLVGWRCRTSDPGRVPRAMCRGLSTGVDRAHTSFNRPTQGIGLSN